MLKSIFSLFSNKPSNILIDGLTTFKLASKESERFKGPFECKLIKTIVHNGDTGYLIEISQTFSGVDFGRGLVAINHFFIIPKHFGSFGNKEENDVLVLLPKDLNIENEWDEENILAWAYIFDIRNRKEVRLEKLQ